jgi:hypothetical protein
VIPDQYTRARKKETNHPPGAGGKQLIVPKVEAKKAHAHSSRRDTGRNREELRVVGRMSQTKGRGRELMEIHGQIFKLKAQK